MRSDSARPTAAGPSGCRRPRSAVLVGLLLVVQCGPRPLPRAYREGQRLQRARQPARALTAYRRARTQCGDDQRACDSSALRVAELLAELGRHDEAVDAYRELARTTPTRAVAARAMLRAGLIVERRLHQVERALALYQQTMVRFPDEVAADDALQAFSRRVHEPRLLPRLVALHARCAATGIADNLEFKIAALRAQRDDWQGALAAYDHLAQTYRHSPLRDDSIWRAAQLLERRGDVDGALRRYRRLLADRRDAFFVGSYNSVYLDDAQLRIGLLLLERRRDFDGALAAFRLLRDDFPHSVLRDDAWWWIAEVHHRRGDRAASCRALRQLVAQFPDGNHARRARQKIAALSCARARFAR